MLLWYDVERGAHRRFFFSEGYLSLEELFYISLPRKRFLGEQIKVLRTPDEKSHGLRGAYSRTLEWKRRFKLGLCRAVAVASTFQIKVDQKTFL